MGPKGAVWEVGIRMFVQRSMRRCRQTATVPNARVSTADWPFDAGVAFVYA